MVGDGDDGVWGRMGMGTNTHPRAARFCRYRPGHHAFGFLVLASRNVCKQCVKRNEGFPSVSVFLSWVSYLSHNRLVLDFFYFFSYI